jgi:hypothetical protein
MFDLPHVTAMSRAEILFFLGNLQFALAWAASFWYIIHSVLEK